MIRYITRSILVNLVILSVFKALCSAVLLRPSNRSLAAL